ncbi:GNAT family N-acetyltransferase [Devosia rhizoryzae]|uniref:GNAT family N-acetyltransferase n=1 Tax=Devosia rhizoryzae TaxID=2774137 RepID=A0ABX7CAL0_9HYPH|nr:GNAT family protein [Devosia rhizoryzae]QQR40304.1 GNAT family N-acetyltransferase [Devosia rhizoryzae]
MSSFSLPIATDRLQLRPFERGDVEAVAAYHTLPAAQRYALRQSRYSSDVADVVGTMRNQVSLQRPGDTLSLAMVRKGDNQLIGQVCLIWSDATSGQGEVRFMLHPAYSGQGYLTEALTTIFNLAFDEFRIHRLTVRCDGRSHHSIKLMQTLGMRLEAHYREHALFQGEWDEELHFAILDREWRPSTKVVDFRRRSATPDLPRAAI